jgi:DNA modification methylase
MEFRSELENIMTAEELNFDPTPAFGKYKSVMPPESVAHPAKFNTNLVEFLILKYTKTGDVILDPMAGTGILGVIASLHGRNAIQVELEKRFYEWMEKARENVEKYPSLTSKGWIVNILGDARCLSELLSRVEYPENPNNIGNLPLGEIDAVITSPPYANIAKSEEGGISPHMQGLISKLSGIPVKEFAHDVEKLKEAVKIAQSKIPFKYSDNPANIGNLPLGEIDAVITSPPYLRSAESGAGVNRQREGDVRIGCSTVEHPDAIDNVREYGSIDVVITSPPYAHESTASKPTKLEELGLFKMGHSNELPYTEEDYREWRKHREGNIGKRKLFIRVPCSPEEAQFHDTRPERKGTIWEWTKEVEATLEVIEKVQRLKNDSKGRSETYLEAMLKVYNEMFKVLKPNGLAIVVIKPFIRNRKVVDLPYHTWLLMSRVGFKLEKLYKLRLKTQSFWRILYYRKNPDVPRIAHEYVIVTRKQTQ